jgi:hypothetical protein
MYDNVIFGVCRHAGWVHAVSSTDDRQTVDLQRDALLAAGVDERHLYSNKASGARDDRTGLKDCLAYLKKATAWLSGSSIAWAGRCLTC